ncbi:hypothetical protein E2C01_092127 [Portunus trituberculatus]|uniref:Uncharacterized protein n=1 Tax=Portunus trituberculatus TaxID=210409 RepID=A0A5B7JUZ4_PORTR|nr:hypothetical protein [Portunus trituberculatus]
MRQSGEGWGRDRTRRGPSRIEAKQVTLSSHMPTKEGVLPMVLRSPTTTTTTTTSSPLISPGRQCSAWRWRGGSIRRNE